MTTISEEPATSDEQLRGDIRGFAETQGRRPRVMIVGLGQGPHGEAAKAVATTYAGLGFDVDIGPLLRSPAECARQAIENDVHAVGVGTPSAREARDGSLLQAIAAELKAQGADDIVVFDAATPASPLASAQDVLRQILAAASA